MAFSSHSPTGLGSNYIGSSYIRETNQFMNTSHGGGGTYPGGLAPAGPERASRSMSTNSLAMEVDEPTYRGEMAKEDVVDDPNTQEPKPTLPPLDRMDHINGYSHVTYSNEVVSPPSPYDEASRYATHEDRPVPNVPRITEEEARDALVHYVGEHCCYGKGAATNMVFTDLKQSNAFHYTLQTFAESRQVAWSFEPYTGQAIDGPRDGLAPGPWDIGIAPPKLFESGSTFLEVPHTASVKACHDCQGMGRMRCFKCIGRGKLVCNHCHGSGRSLGHHREMGHRDDHFHDNHFHDPNFHDPYGRPGHDHLSPGMHGMETNHHHGHHGRRHHGLIHYRHSGYHNQEDDRCSWCHGTGRRRRVHKDDHIAEFTDLPDELIREVTGEVAFQEEQQKVWPITHFPDETVNKASRKIYDKHHHNFPMERIIMQRHTVRIVPVCEATYEWKGKTGRFFTYGFEHQVYAPDYPQTVCCGCTII